MFPIVVYVFISIQLLFVAYIDFKTQKIANMWMLINFLFFCLLTIVFPTVYIWSFEAFVFPLAFLLVGFALYMAHIMGGGDSKYLSSLYILVPLNMQETVFTYLLYATILVGSTLLLFNILKNLDIIIIHFKMRDIAGIKKIFGKKFTYAPVIFIAWMWFGWQNYKILSF
ncbi:prepilin peptidase [Bacteriovorax sp. PP10]|uniref:Prepilin peptidase n=1 Tax=Bacteriovorax antarcticus TaxID=3088717 RepID=A0ABU5VQH1_9BACT|nr:prepilin peptidase [Bacteriovorax sp. PP10]MEA9354614.1 prepilin peptidase [Bacteriovorax sp. PP10]